MAPTKVDARTLSLHERQLLLGLEKASGEVPFARARELAGLGEAEAANAASWLASKGLVAERVETRKVALLGPEGRRYVEAGLPEWRALKAAERSGGRVTTDELVRAGDLSQGEVSIALGWLKRQGLAQIGKEEGRTVVSLTAEARGAATRGLPLQAALKDIASAVEFPVERDAANVQLLASRQNVVEVREQASRFLRITDAGLSLVEEGLEAREEIGEITPEVIRSRTWETQGIRPYDVTAFAPAATGGKPHPMMELIAEIREIFVGLGFQEIEGHYVEPAFWNMDALFIPQDHPAREMQDTFYVSEPKELPSDARLEPLIRKVHEEGGGTGSRGWGGTWDPKEGRRPLLRTHTTVNTIRYLAAHPEPPAKVFSIGRVFRNETMDATHLPEFHQIEGIVVEEGANFRRLLGILGEFYRRMGFPNIQFRPSYYPYTEPSLDVAVEWRGRWLELGGAGVFREEVTKPLGVPVPVLAWGLGLERLAMLRFGLKDIRDLYLSDVEWLRNAPIGRPKSVRKA